MKKSEMITLVRQRLWNWSYRVRTAKVENTSYDLVVNNSVRLLVASSKKEAIKASLETKDFDVCAVVVEDATRAGGYGVLFFSVNNEGTYDPRDIIPRD